MLTLSSTEPIREVELPASDLKTRVEDVTGRIKRATFTGKGDEETVVNLYIKYVDRIAASLQGDDAECPICTAEYEQGDTLCLMPACAHAFHSKCIRDWLDRERTCPVCTRDVFADLAALQSEYGDGDVLERLCGRIQGQRRRSSNYLGFCSRHGSGGGRWGRRRRNELSLLGMPFMA